jgi:hypothetical protein
LTAKLAEAHSSVAAERSRRHAAEAAVAALEDELAVLRGAERLRLERRRQALERKERERHARAHDHWLWVAPSALDTPPVAVGPPAQGQTQGQGHQGVEVAASPTSSASAHASPRPSPKAVSISASGPAVQVSPHHPSSRPSPRPSPTAHASKPGFSGVAAARPYSARYASTGVTTKDRQRPSTARARPNAGSTNSTACRHGYGSSGAMSSHGAGSGPQPTKPRQPRPQTACARCSRDPHAEPVIKIDAGVLDKLSAPESPRAEPPVVPEARSKLPPELLLDPSLIPPRHVRMRLDMEEVHE